MKRAAIADLPLHGVRVPVRLAERVSTLGTAIVEHIVLAYGTSEFVTRMSDPFWFQALGCVMGMDWHSSGITSSVMGASKLGINLRFSGWESLSVGAAADTLFELPRSCEISATKAV